MSQLMHYIRESESISFGRIDGLEALYNNGLISEENYNCLLEIKKLTNGSGTEDYNIFDLKEQARNVYTEIERVIAERTAEKVIVESYVNEDVLRDVLNYNIDKLDENFVEQLRALMLEGGIVTDTSILFFLATIGVETGEEVLLLEDRDDFDGLSYTWNTRGAGVIQVTGGTQKEFIEYLTNHIDDKEEIIRLKDYYVGFYTFEVPIYGADGEVVKKITVWDNSYTYNGMTVAEYIAEYYPYESAVWFWSYNQASFEIDGQYLSINECIEQYNGVVDDDTMFLAVTCAVNGSEFGTRGKGRFLYPYNDVTIVGNKIELTFVDTEDDMVGTPAYYNSYQYTNEDGYRVYKQTSYIPNGWDRRSTLYDNLKDYFKEN